jgi:subtilisin-like proprotein convertase family protein
MKPIIASLLLLSGTNASAITAIISATPNLAIPDNSSVGVADFQSLTTPIEYIESIEVTLNITGGFNGDYYVYLQHGTGFSVLLNRPGKTVLNEFGYGDAGVFATFAQAAVNGDSHTYQSIINPAGGQLTGKWQPDGRNIDPLNALDTTPRTAMLDSFVGNDANGQWTLFVADRSSGGIGTLNSYTITINGIIPEPTSAILAGSGLFGLLARKRRAPRGSS